jgi:hypothetical protein
MAPLAFDALLMEICYYVQLDRLVKELIVPLENQISSEQEKKQAVVVKNETREIQEIVGQKRRARTLEGTASTRSSASKEQMVAVFGTRRSKRVKVSVAPILYVPEVEEESWEASPHATSGVVPRNSPLLDDSSATDETMAVMNGGNEDGENSTDSSQRDSATVAAATMVHKARKGKHTFDKRFNDLMAFKAEFGHCNVPKTKSRNLSLGRWCSGIRLSYKAIKEGRNPGCKLSKADIQRLENSGFEWKVSKRIPFDERLQDLMAFKAEYGHCNVTKTRSSNNKYYSLGRWCCDIRVSYKAIKEGRNPAYKLSKADIQRLENAGFEWNRSKKVPFDERLQDLIAFKAEYGHCNVPQTQSRNNTSLGRWCSTMRQSYKAIKEGRNPHYKLSKADIQRLENAGFEWVIF